jgi:hypothetical protein
MMERSLEIWKSGSGRPKNLEWLAGHLFQILCKKSKSRPCKNLASLNLESGTTFFAKKGEKHEKINKKRITAGTQ